MLNFSSVIGEYTLLGRGTNEFVLVAELWQENKLVVYSSVDNGASFSLTHTISGGVDRVYFEDFKRSASGYHIGYAIEGAAVKETGITTSPTGGAGSWTNEVVSLSTNMLYRAMLISPTVADIAVLYDRSGSEYVFYRKGEAGWMEYNRITYGWEARDLWLFEQAGTQYLIIEDAFISEYHGNWLHVWRSLNGGDSWMPYDMIPELNVYTEGDVAYFQTDYQWFTIKDALWMGTEPNNHPRETFEQMGNGGYPSIAEAGIAASAQGGVELVFGNLGFGGYYTVERSVDLAAWTAVTNFRGYDQSVTLPVATQGEVGFYKASGIAEAGQMLLTMRVESWPAQTLNPPVLFFSTDHWASTNRVTMSYETTIGENDVWQCIPGQFTKGSLIRYFFEGNGRSCQSFRFPGSDDFTTTVPLEP